MARLIGVALIVAGGWLGHATYTGHGGAAILGLLLGGAGVLLLIGSVNTR